VGSVAKSPDSVVWHVNYVNRSVGGAECSTKGTLSNVVFKQFQSSIALKA